MTFDNDGNALDTAPRFPSDPPRRPGAEGAQTDAEGVAAPARTPAAAPSESNSASDSTSPRATVRAILAGLGPAERAAVVAAVLAFARALSALAAAVAGGLSRPTALAMGDAAARVLVGDSTEVHEVDDNEPAPFAPVCALLGAWWQSGPYDLAREAARGSVSPADFADAVAFLSGESTAPAEEPAQVSTPAQSITRAYLLSLACRAARELDGVTHGRDAATDAALSTAARVTLAVIGAADACTSAEHPAYALAEMGEALAAVAALEAAQPGRCGDSNAVVFGDHCAAAVAMLDTAREVIAAGRALAMAAPGRHMDAVSWPE